MMDVFTIEGIELSDNSIAHADIEVTHFLDVEGSYKYNAASDLDYYGYSEVDWRWVSYELFIGEDGEEAGTHIGEPKNYNGDSDDFIRDALIELMRKQALIERDHDLEMQYSLAI